MAGTYVQITREELEAWLESLPWKWSRVQGKAGIYHIHLSDVVAVKLSSTIGSNDDAKGLGQASMQLSLVSRVTGQVLNKKAQGQDHFKRTKNWQATWKDGVGRMKDAYMKSQGFYDAIATIADRAKYKQETLAKIESVPGWQSHDILGDFHKKILQDGVLTAKQMALLDKLAAPQPQPKPQNNVWFLVPRSADGDVFSDHSFAVKGPNQVEYEEYQNHMDGGDVVDRKNLSFQEAATLWTKLVGKGYIPPTNIRQPDPPFLAPAVAPQPGGLYQRTRDLWRAAERTNDTWLMDFLRSVGPRVRDNLPISEKQMAVLEKNLGRYKVGRLREEPYDPYVQPKMFVEHPKKHFLDREKNRFSPTESMTSDTIEWWKKGEPRPMSEVFPAKDVYTRPPVHFASKAIRPGDIVEVPQFGTRVKGKVLKVVRNGTWPDEGMSDDHPGAFKTDLAVVKTEGGQTVRVPLRWFSLR